MTAFLVQIALVVLLALSAVWLASRIYASARLQGIKEAMGEMARGVGANYQRPGAPAPESVARCLAALRADTAKAVGARRKGDVIVKHLRTLGKEMGGAAWQNGNEQGRLPINNEIRLDISLRDLLTIRWLAHVGFKLMMRTKTEEKFRFRDEKDAQESNFAIDRLEWRLSQEHKDPSAPYALALCRQQMIWERWPQNNEAAQPTQEAA